MMNHKALLRGNVVPLDPLLLRRLAPPPAGDDKGAISRKPYHNAREGVRVQAWFGRPSGSEGLRPQSGRPVRSVLDDAERSICPAGPDLRRLQQIVVGFADLGRPVRGSLRGQGTVVRERLKEAG